MGFPKWYDGPLLAAWLRQQGALDGEGRSSFARVVNKWQNGENPSYLTVDNWVTPRGIHLDEIPESFAREARRGGNPFAARSPAVAARLRAEGLKLIREGARNLHIANHLGVHPRTVSKWRKNMELGKYGDEQ